MASKASFCFRGSFGFSRTLALDFYLCQLHSNGSAWIILVSISSKISPTYPWKIPQTFHQQFMKGFLSFWGFGEVWGIFPGYVGKIMEQWLITMVIFIAVLSFGASLEKPQRSLLPLRPVKQSCRDAESEM